MKTVATTVEVTSKPVSYDDGYQADHVTYLARGYSGPTSTNCATIYLVTGNNAETYIFYNFSFDIPSGATINSVGCDVKCSITTSGYVQSRQVQLYSGQTAMGSAKTIPTNASVVSITTPGTWTVSDLQNAKIRYYAQRNTSNVNNEQYIRAFGAEFTVNYTYDQTVCEMTLSNSSQDVTVTLSGDEIPVGDDCTVNFVGDITNIIVEDNGVDVTSSLVASLEQEIDYTYTIQGVLADHTITVTSALPPEDNIYIKVNGSWIKTNDIYIKKSGAWHKVIAVYKKAGGVWELQSDKSALFNYAQYLK